MFRTPLVNGVDSYLASPLLRMIVAEELYVHLIRVSAALIDSGNHSHPSSEYKEVMGFTMNSRDI